VLSLVNQTDTEFIPITDGSHVIVYFKVDTNGYLNKPPLLSFKGSNFTLRWIVTYYAATSSGIGEIIHDTTNVICFYVRLETVTKYSNQYDDGTYSIHAENKCGLDTLNIILKGIYKHIGKYKLAIKNW